MTVSVRAPAGVHNVVASVPPALGENGIDSQCPGSGFSVRAVPGARPARTATTAAGIRTAAGE
jgi:hypothetical protein